MDLWLLLLNLLSKSFVVNIQMKPIRQNFYIVPLITLIFTERNLKFSSYFCFYQPLLRQLQESNCYFFVYRDPSEMVRPRIAMSACVEAFAAPEIIDDFYSTAIQAKSVAQKWVYVRQHEV